MGAVISYFRREPPTLEQQLDETEKKIFAIHEFNEATEHAMKKIIGAIVFYGWIMIILGGFVSYFYFDRTLKSSVACLSPLVLAPFVLMGSKKLLQSYYKSRLSNKKGELNLLIKEKKTLIDKVKDTETYKKAQELLEKYDPDTKLRRAQAEQQKIMQTVLQQTGEISQTPRTQLTKPTPTDGIDIRHRPIGTPMGAAAQQRFGAQAPFTPLRNNQFKSDAQIKSLNSTPSRNPYIQKTPRPILPQNRTVMEKVVDYIAGEGPNNRFALICKSCTSHNGMALSEEFEYLSYRCCYCGYFNPSRKQRPLAPTHNLSKANSTVSLNDISRSGSPTPSGPAQKDSDQESDVSRVVEDVQIPEELEIPEGKRQPPEGDESSLKEQSD